MTDNIRELWKALDSNGFDVWVCSASCTGAIRAAIDTFGLHDHCTGVLAMTNKTDDDGRYLSEFDYENGKRTLRNSSSSILFGSNKEVLFKNADNETQLQRMIDDKMTTEDIINTWSLKQEAGANGFDFNTGFLTEYAGYHSHP